MTIKTVEQASEGLKRAFMLTIPAKDIEARLETEVKRIAPQVRMPGFRPGKVPPNLIKKMHGEALQQDALNNAVQAGVEQLLTETGVRPALRPEVSLDSYEPGKDAEVKVVVEALPVVSDVNLEGLKIERLAVEADDKNIDEQVAALAQGAKSWKDAPKKHAAAAGDLVVMDFEGSVEGEKFDGGTGEDLSVELGTNRLIPGFEDQLVGARVGDERSVEVIFPADYPNEKLRSKPATFAVKVKAVKTASEGKVDDDFAKTLGLGSLDQLKDLIRSQLEQQLYGLTRTHMKRQLLDQLAERHDFAVPEGMVEAEFRNIQAQLREEASREPDPKAAMEEIEKDADEYRHIAERRVRLGLLLSEIGARVGIEITDSEMNNLIASAAAQYQGKDRETFLNFVRQEPAAQAQLRAPLYEDKVVDYLFTQAAITDRAATREELEADLESEEGHVHGPGCGHDHVAAKPAAKGARAKPAAKKADAKPAAKKADATLVKESPKKPEAKPAAKKAAAKPAAKKAEAKPAAKKFEAKPAAKKFEAKPAAKKVEAKPAAKKADAKPAAQKSAKKAK